jgi:hypothetical protein
LTYLFLPDILDVVVRPLHIEYPGSFYHLTSRGNKKINLFLRTEKRDRKSPKRSKSTDILNGPLRNIWGFILRISTRYQAIEGNINIMDLPPRTAMLGDGV